MKSLYQHWPKTCAVGALFSIIILSSSAHTMGLLMFAIWLQLPIYLLHQASFLDIFANVLGFGIALVIHIIFVAYVIRRG
jgi:hypothetical protein